MDGFRRLFSYLLIALSFILFFSFLFLWSARFWAVECEVSQVFKLSKSVHLAGENYVGIYDVAVTPLEGPDVMARVCGLYTVTPERYLNLLDKKVWLFPLEDYRFAYYETPQAAYFNYFDLIGSVLAMVLGILIYRENDQ